MRRLSWGELLSCLPSLVSGGLRPPESPLERVLLGRCATRRGSFRFFEGPLGAGGETSFGRCGLCWARRPCFHPWPDAEVVDARGRRRAAPGEVCLACLRGRSGWRVTLTAPGILRRPAVFPAPQLLACA